jgi:drug/metabolite transporter (DMT)-like permease
MESQTPESRVKVGLGLVFFSSLLFAGGNLFVKQATEEVSPFVVAFWRGAVGLVLVLLLSRFKIGKLLGTNRLLLLLRGVGGTLALILFFSSIMHTSLSNAVGLFNTYPLFTTIIGVLFFKEPWRKVYILALLCSLGGVLLIVRPELGFVGTGEVLGLTSVFFVGWVINLVRYLRKTDSVYADHEHRYLLARMESGNHRLHSPVASAVCSWISHHAGTALHDSRVHLLYRRGR